MLTGSQLQQALRKRLYYREVRDMTKEAFAAYYGRDLLYPFIEPFSPKEDRVKIRTRAEKTVKHYENYPLEISQLYVEGVYKTGEVKRSSGVKELDEYFQIEYDSYFQNAIAPFLLLQPELFIYFAWPKVDELPASRHAQRELKLWPRPFIETADHILNFETDSDGDLVWVSRDMGDYVEVLDNGFVYKLDRKGTSIGTPQAHGFQTIPCIRAVYKENKAYPAPVGHAYLHEVVQKSLACLQYTSMLVEAGYFHLSLQLVMGQRTFDNTNGQLGNDRVIIEEAGDEPQTRFLAKPDLEFSTLVDLVFDKIPKAIYRAARLRDRSTEQNISGVAKLLDAVPELAALSSIATYFHKVDEQATSIIASAYEGKEILTDIAYPNNFDMRSSEEIMASVISVADASSKSDDIPISRTLYKSLMVQAAKTMLPDAAPKLLSEIEKEFEEHILEMEEADEEPELVDPIAPQSELDAKKQEPSIIQNDNPSVQPSKVPNGKSPARPLKMTPKQKRAQTKKQAPKAF